MRKPKPPGWPDRFLEWYCSKQYLEEVQGDLHEWFKRRVVKSGTFKAKLLYPLDVISYLRLFRVKNLNDMEQKSNVLFFSYLKMAARQFKRNLGYSLMNTFGLAIGLISAIMISLFILDELSFDRFHKDYQSIYRLVNHTPSSGRMGDATPSPWKANMEIEFPEILAHTRLGQDVVLIDDGDQSFLENSFYWADANFLEFFSFKVLYGDKATMLAEPNGIVLTETKALRYFNKTDVVGELLPIKVYDGNKDFLMKVTGVIEDIPNNSHLQFDFLGSMSTTSEMYARFEKIWGLNWMQAYVRLPKNQDISLLENKMPDFFEKYRGQGSSEFSDVIFQPLKSVRLDSENVEGKLAKGDKNNLLLFGFVAMLILLAASINYVNLTTAKSTRRGKEVGMRKVFGAAKKQVVRQFYVECGLQLFIAFIVAIGTAALILPSFNAVVDKEIQIADIFQPSVLTVVGSLFLLILILSGFYPALVMNRFKPVEVLRNSLVSVVGNRSWLRKAQVLVQFSIATFLISSTLIVINQMQHFNRFDMGFNSEQLINIPVDDRNLQAQLNLIKDRMKGVPGVVEITASGEALPSAMNNTWGFEWTGKNDDQNEGVNIVAIDYDYLRTIETELVMGRNLSAELSSDSTTVCLLNEAAFNLTGWQDLEDKKVKIGGNERIVAGVVEDFHYTSLHSSVAPAAYMLIKPGARVSPDNLLLRMETTNLSSALNGLDEIWREFSQQPFDFSFVDQAFARLYGDEQKFMKVLISFAGVGIFLGVLGLVGLVSFVAERRAKEISIRKVLGASRQSILSKVGGQFVQIFVVSALVALPLSWLAMSEWIQGFAYAVELGWELFALAALIALSITLLSIGTHTIRIASANPTKHLSDQ